MNARTAVLGAPRWLVRGPAHPGAVRLFCFPHGGGAPAEYARWARNLPGLEVCAVQLPGRGTRVRENPFTDLDALVDAVTEQVPFGPGRFVFFGHSLGALIAFEVARRLRARGCRLPERLIVSAFPAPHRPHTAPTVHQLPDGDLVAEVNRRHGGVPPEVLTEPTLLQLVANQLRADYQVLESYRWREQAPLPVPVTVFAGRDDAVAGAEVLDWQRHTTEPLRTHWFPGGHFYLRDGAAAVHRAILRVLAETSSEVA